MGDSGKFREEKWPFPVPVARVVVLDEQGRFLLLRRGNTRYGEGEWCLPGGKIDYLSSPEESAVREVKEETDLDLVEIRFLFYVNSAPLWEGAMHCINFYFVGRGMGQVGLNPESSEAKWIRREERGQYPIAFGGGEAVDKWLST